MINFYTVCAVVNSCKVNFLTFATGLSAVLFHVAFVLSSANSPTNILVTSGIRNLVFANSWRSGVVHIWTKKWLNLNKFLKKTYFRYLPHPYMFLINLISLSLNCSADPSFLVSTVEIYKSFFNFVCLL